MKVVIAHEEPLIRSGLQMVLEDGGAEVVASAGDKYDAVRYARGHKADVLVADECCADGLNGDLPDTRLVVLSSATCPSEMVESLRNGATSLVMTSESAETLVAAVRDERPYVNPRVAIEIARYEGDDRDLTERELGILRLVSLGYTNAEAASELFLSIRTVESHRAHIMEKVGVETRRELVAYARERALI
jgi:two-component system response regulator NreC